MKRNNAVEEKYQPFLYNEESAFGREQEKPELVIMKSYALAFHGSGFS